MILNKRIDLHGNKQERVVEALKMAGWYKNRRVDITNTESYYNEINIELFQRAKDFFSEFFGIAGQWYIEVINLDHSPDFSFYLCPYPNPHPSPYNIDARDYIYDNEQYEVYSTAYEAVLDLANENIIFVGEIGYYYPARVWIGEGGKLYTTHEYDDKVCVFASIVELILDELAFHEMKSVLIK